jgi:hypothetical protein
MRTNIPVTEIPQRATYGQSLAIAIDAVRELIELRVGFGLELASLEPFDRDGHTNIRVQWRRRAVELNLAA